MKDPEVVILGSGYAGLRCAYDLAHMRHRSRPFSLSIVTNEPSHIEYPMLYEAATACLPQETTDSSERITRSVSVPLTDIFSHLPISVRTGIVEAIDVSERRVLLKGDRVISYDLLVSALGAQVATYGVSGVQHNAFMVKTLSETLRLRHHIVRQFFLAAKAQRDERRERLTFVIVGGGATGVETAAELAGHAQEQCSVHAVAREDVRIILLEAGPTILGMLPDSLRTTAQTRLQALGVEVVPNAFVEVITPEEVLWERGVKRVKTQTTIWAGGLGLLPALAQSKITCSGRGILVRPTLQSVDSDQVFAIGDGAVIDGKEKVIPANVPVAYAQGALTARNVFGLINDKPLKRFEYKERGQLIALGGKVALLALPRGWGWAGFLPWAAKRIVSLVYWLRFLPLRRALDFWIKSSRLQLRND